ncbi:MAG TPA: ATP synthase F1 subunit gamma [Myxococcota bacterium]|nr:ATP synthase F1 subunit gamma [Myxococcota bacterium]
MPSLRDLRRRIQSVKKTQQITRAMRMVSAAKLRRAQERILAARPYSDRMIRMLQDVLASNPELDHPLLQPPKATTRLELVVVTSDRGLAGAFNVNVLKLAQREIVEHASEFEGISLYLLGRKAVEFFRRRRPHEIDVAKLFGVASYDTAVEVARHLAKRYLAGEIGGARIVYSEFASALSQAPRVVRLLPQRNQKAEDAVPFDAEPDLAKLLTLLVPKTFEVAIYRALLESEAGEHAARMTAMEAATRNGEEMVGSLTLRFNRARQAAITRELVEIITGAEAL